jgi:hypothetical protein
MHSGEADDIAHRRNGTDRASRERRERSGVAYDQPERRRRLRSPEREDRVERVPPDRAAAPEREAVRGAAVRDEEPERTGTGPRRRLTAEKVARLAADYVAEMTGKEAEGITSLERSDDGLWQVDVEVVEIQRIPETTDILAIYRTELDPKGELVAYRRIERYSRCQVGER